MKLESIALHQGYQSEATTKAAAVPIYQTTSYTFDDTQHGADLFMIVVHGSAISKGIAIGKDLVKQITGTDTAIDITSPSDNRRVCCARAVQQLGSVRMFQCRTESKDKVHINAAR